MFFGCIQFYFRIFYGHMKQILFEKFFYLVESFFANFIPCSKYLNNDICGKVSRESITN